MLLATAAALVWANLSPSYFHLFDFEVLPTFTFRDVINELLMALFFLVVTIEIRHELAVGELSSRHRAALPVAAALGGMVVPALIYLAFNHHTSYERGWGTPMATDIAFTLGILQLLGKRTRPAILVFVAALAIADDLGAVIVIAGFYNHSVDPVMLVLAAVVASAIYLQTRKWPAPVITIVLALIMWWLVRTSGVHATIAAVVLGFLLPSRPGVEDPVADKLKEPVDWIVLPLFALANAGVLLSLSDGFTPSIFFGVSLGLLIGKPIGILLFSAVAVRAGIAQMPDGVGWRRLTGAAILCGIGFTMSLFIAELALDADANAFASAKLAVLVGSVAAGIIGYAVSHTTAGDGAK